MKTIFARCLVARRESSREGKSNSHAGRVRAHQDIVDRLELLRFGITVMSRAAKAFLATSLVVTGVTVWGVHFIQAREEEVSPDRSIWCCTSLTLGRKAMYQGVVKDEARMKARAVKKAAESAAAPKEETYQGLAPPSATTAQRKAEYERNLKLQEELAREQGMRRAEQELMGYEKDREVVRRQENLGREV
jgi:hypothetical protein